MTDGTRLARSKHVSARSGPLQPSTTTQHSDKQLFTADMQQTEEQLSAETAETIAGVLEAVPGSSRKVTRRVKSMLRAWSFSDRQRPLASTSVACNADDDLQLPVRSLSSVFQDSCHQQATSFDARSDVHVTERALQHAQNLVTDLLCQLRRQGQKGQAFTQTAAQLPSDSQPANKPCVCVCAHHTYKPASSSRRMTIKISGCHPDDIPGMLDGRDWKGALRAKLAAQGIFLHRILVRAGCVNLTLDMALPDYEPAGPGGNVSNNNNSTSTASTQPAQAATLEQAQHANNQAQVAQNQQLQQQESAPVVLLPPPLQTGNSPVTVQHIDHIGMQATDRQSEITPITPSTVHPMPGFTVSVHATLPRQGPQMQAGDLDAMMPEQLLGLVDPGLLQGRQVLLQTDWCVQGSHNASMQTAAPDTGGQQQMLLNSGDRSAWIVNCGDQVQFTLQHALANWLLQQQQQQQSNQQGIDQQQDGLRHTVIQPEGAMLPATIQALPSLVPPLDMLYVFPSIMPAWRHKNFTVHALVRLNPLYTSTVAKQQATTIQQHQGQDAEALVFESAWQQLGSITCYVRAGDQYLPAASRPAELQSVQDQIPEPLLPQVQQLVGSGAWRLLALDINAAQPLAPGLLHLEVQASKGPPFFGNSVPLLFVPNASVAAELQPLALDVLAGSIGVAMQSGLPADNSRITGSNALLQDLGVLMALLQQISDGLVAPTTGAMHNLPVVPGWAGQLVIRLMLAAIASGWPVTTALLGDALQVLGVGWYDLETTCMETEGMTLLHLMARCGCIATAAAALSAGCAAGYDWQLVALGPDQHHLTALHLAAVLPQRDISCGMVELLLHTVPGAGDAWGNALCGGEAASSPHDMAMAVGNLDAVDIAEFILGTARSQPQAASLQGELALQPPLELNQDIAVLEDQEAIFDGYLVTQPNPLAPQEPVVPLHLQQQQDEGSGQTSQDTNNQEGSLLDIPPSMHVITLQQLKLVCGMGDGPAALSEQTTLNSSQLRANQAVLRMTSGSLTTQQTQPPAVTASYSAGNPVITEGVQTISLDTTAIGINPSGSLGGVMQNIVRTDCSTLPPGCVLQQEPVTGNSADNRASFATVESEQEPCQPETQSLCSPAAIAFAEDIDSDIEAAADWVSQPPALSPLNDSPPTTTREHYGKPAVDDVATEQAATPYCALNTHSSEGSLAQPGTCQDTAGVLADKIAAAAAGTHHAHGLPQTNAGNNRFFRMASLSAQEAGMVYNAFPDSPMAQEQQSPHRHSGDDSNANRITENTHILEAVQQDDNVFSSARSNVAFDIIPAGAIGIVDEASYPKAAENILQLGLQPQPVAVQDSPKQFLLECVNHHEQDVTGEWDLLSRAGEDNGKEARASSAPMHPFNMLRLGTNAPPMPERLSAGELTHTRTTCGQSVWNRKQPGNVTAVAGGSGSNRSSSSQQLSSSGIRQRHMSGGMHHEEEHKAATTTTSTIVAPQGVICNEMDSVGVNSELFAFSGNAQSSPATQQTLARQSQNAALVTREGVITTMVGINNDSSNITNLNPILTSAAHQRQQQQSSWPLVQQLAGVVQNNACQWLVAARLIFPDPHLEHRYAMQRASAQVKAVDPLAGCLFLMLTILPAVMMIAQAQWGQVVIHLAFNSVWFGPYILLVVARNTYIAHRDLLLACSEIAKVGLTCGVLAGVCQYPEGWAFFTNSFMDLIMLALLKPLAIQVRSHMACLGHALSFFSDVHMYRCLVYNHGSPATAWAWSYGRSTAQSLLSLCIQLTLDRRARRTFLSAQVARENRFIHTGMQAGHQTNRHVELYATSQDLRQRTSTQEY